MPTLLNDQTLLPRPKPSPPGRPWYRRGGTLAPLVAMAVTAVVAGAVLVATAGPTTVVGTAREPAVTSALTGEALAVTLTLPDGTTTSIDTNGAVDRVKPGDQVSISADGYVPAKVRVGADRTVKASLQPTLATVTTQLNTWAEDKNTDAITNWVFSPATGLQFTPSTGTEMEGGDVPWWAVFDVVGKNTTVDAALLPGVLADVEMVRSMFGDNAEKVTLAGQPAWHGPVFDGVVASLWIRSPLVITATGTDLSTTDAVLAAMIAAQPAR